MKPGVLNGLGQAATLGAVLVALLVIFQLFALAPWPSKAEVLSLQRELNGFKGDIQRELNELREDVRELLRRLPRP